MHFLTGDLVIWAATLCMVKFLGRMLCRLKVCYQDIQFREWGDIIQIEERSLSSCCSLTQQKLLIVRIPSVESFWCAPRTDSGGGSVLPKLSWQIHEPLSVMFS